MKPAKGFKGNCVLCNQVINGDCFVKDFIIKPICMDCVKEIVNGEWVPTTVRTLRACEICNRVFSDGEIAYSRYGVLICEECVNEIKNLAEEVED